MIKDMDISRAIRTFKEWDLKGKWKKPDPIFINHLSEKSDDCLSVSEVLIKVIENGKWPDLLPGKKRFNPTLWIINACYIACFLMRSCCWRMMVNSGLMMQKIHIKLFYWPLYIISL